MSESGPDPTVADGGAELTCPRCGARYGTSARFCERCRLPLVLASADETIDDSVSARHSRARKIKPQLTEGELVKVVQARNQVEAEFIQGLLLEEGIPSVLRRSRGFDVPDFLAAGPRDVLVAQSAVVTAREVLLQAELIADPPAGAAAPGGAQSPVKLLAVLLGALALSVLVVWLLSQLFG